MVQIGHELKEVLFISLCACFSLFWPEGDIFILITQDPDLKSLHEITYEYTFLSRAAPCLNTLRLSQESSYSVLEH